MEIKTQRQESIDDAKRLGIGNGMEPVVTHNKKTGNYSLHFEKLGSKSIGDIEDLGVDGERTITDIPMRPF